MSDRKTTIILVLLAGDKDTSGRLDNLLAEIQHGVTAWRGSDLPDVFCCYHRWMEQSEPETFHYRIRRNSLHFIDESDLDVRPGVYPPCGGRRLTGAINDQVWQFITELRDDLCDVGPIRLIFGAHGVASLGIDPEQLLLLLWEVILSPLTSTLDKETWQKRLEFLRQRILQVGPPVGGLTSKPHQNAPDLTLDRAAAALDLLPRERLATLILHACKLSGVETVNALQLVPHHIACQSDLDSTMLFSRWLSTFGDPDARESDITGACFSNLRTNTVDCCVSSYQTTEISALLEKVNALGDQLYTLLDANKRAINRAIIASATSLYTVDLGMFCKRLCDLHVITLEQLQVITSHIDNLHVSTLKLGDTWTPRVDFKGISIFLPEMGLLQAPTIPELPRSFREAVPRWCDFADLCRRTTT